MWDEGIRAPLVVAALDAFSGVRESVLKSEFKALFPHLTGLMCSSQAPVRQTISRLMISLLPTMLPQQPEEGGKEDGEDTQDVQELSMSIEADGNIVEAM